jgi:hypothetical protein
MRKLLMFIGILVAPSLAAAQSATEAIWLKKPQGVELIQIPWVTVSYKDFMVDARYSFEASRSTAVFFGYSTKVGKFSITPAVGGLLGNYKAVGAQLYTSTSVGPVALFLMNEVGQGRNDMWDFQYHLLTSAVSPLPWLSVGVDAQLWRDNTDNVSYIDVGPAIKASYQKTWIKAWVATNTTEGGRSKFYVGMGTAIP